MIHPVFHYTERMFFLKAEESILFASHSERKEAISELIGSTTFDKGYYLLLALAVLIVTPGLLLDNAAVIIGGMVIAPLLSPILLFALSLTTGSMKGLYHATIVLLLSVIIILAVSSGLTWIMLYTTDEVHLITKQPEPALYAFIAFFSGVTAAFAWVKKDIAPTIAGIAIAVSLLPPLAASGVGIAVQNLPYTAAGAMIFGINVIGIICGAIGIFFIFGFFRESKDMDNALREESLD